MVKHICPYCKKEFNRKSNYDYHLKNKKKVCFKDNVTFLEENIKLTEINTKLTKINKNIKNENNEKIKSNKENICNYCQKEFINNYTLKRHIFNYCKVKKLDEEKKEQIFNKLIEKDEKLDKIINSFDKLQKNNDNLVKENKYLREQLKDLEKNFNEKIKQIINKNVNNSHNTINNNITNNIIIPADKLVSFGKEDLTKITYGSIIKTVGNWDVTGYRIFTELLKLIHFNEKFPEFQNVYMTDKNREKYMVWNGSDWVLNDICLKQIIDKIQKLVIINEDDFEEAKKNKNFKDILTKLMKYINKYYDETNDGLVDHDFIELVNKQLREYLYNNRGVPKKNYLKLKDDIANKKSIITPIKKKNDSNDLLIL